MAVFKPRERLVYFRISEDEFHQFVGLCEQEGARSVSDLARSAVQRLIADGSRPGGRGSVFVPLPRSDASWPRTGSSTVGGYRELDGRWTAAWISRVRCVHLGRRGRVVPASASRQGRPRCAPRRPLIFCPGSLACHLSAAKRGSGQGWQVPHKDPTTPAGLLGRL